MAYSGFLSSGIIPDLYGSLVFKIIAVLLRKYIKDDILMSTGMSRHV
jgi:hypothetical protein